MSPSSSDCVRDDGVGADDGAAPPDDVDGSTATGADAGRSAESREWRYPDTWPDAAPPSVGDWTLRDALKAAVPLTVGAMVVWVPWVVLVIWATREVVTLVDISPVVALAVVVTVTLTTLSSFLFSAVVLVDRLLPWTSPLNV
jgi:hypothetical protein